MRKIIAASLFTVAAGLAFTGTASAQEAPEAASIWCDTDKYTLGCYTDGTPRYDGLSYWEAKNRYAEDLKAEAEANPTPEAPSFFDNVTSLFDMLSTGSAGGDTDTDTEEDAA